MDGNIIVTKTNFKAFEKVCEDRFNGDYEVFEEHELAYIVNVVFTDIQDIFSLGQIFEQEKFNNLKQ
ncbi:hypothetical protein [Lacinutrix sp. Hel_I_90]|uniref:hypothetical protein n=1 Tax=Lacinutrix sp. Hel_I_90 TaxID=1249999 RepID=UPI0005C9C747|nr:hypothetical protein [Lacinutrix sp. Hel_I_90]